MSEYSETLETSEDGHFRVQLVLDPYPDEPYDDGQSPLMRLDYSGYGYRAEHIMATGRPLDADSYVEAAAERWGTDFGLLEKYLRAYHGTTQVKTWHSGDYWYITYDSAAWREYIGVTADKAEAWLADHSDSINLNEYRAYCEGDVWFWVVEKNVTWHRDDDPDETMETWETVDSCGGYYGSDGENGEYLKSCALEALEYAVEADQEAARKRLEYLREELRGERISQGELADLQGLAPYIEDGDVELLEAAGVPELPEDPADQEITS